MSSIDVRNALNELGRYFGVRSGDVYLTSILDKDFDMFDPTTKIDLNADPIGKLLNVISGDGVKSAPTTDAIIKYIEAQGGKEKDSLKKFAEWICITPHKKSAVGSEKTIPFNMLELKADKTYGDQGYGKPAGEYYTIADLSKKSADTSDATEPKVSVIQIFPAAANIGNNDTDVVSLFLSAVPTLELSRAVPYIDILTTVLTNEDNDTKTKPLSLGRWLLGEDIPKTEAAGLHTADFADFQEKIPPKEDGEEQKPWFTAAASMEIFTSPQTMVNADRAYEQIAEGTIRDPFRPFLSLENLSLSVAPSGGMYSYKSGTIKLKLHDKSMLGSITNIIRPGLTKLIITYGWSHPDGAPERRSSADPNRFGELIDSLKVTEEYQVFNSSMSFEESGEVSIDLTIGLAGMDELQRVDITLPGMTKKVSSLEDIFERVHKKLNEIKKSNPEGASKITNMETMDAASSLDSALNIDPKKMAKLLKWLSSSSSGAKKNPDLKAINSDLLKLFTEKGNKKGKLNSLSDTRTKAIKAMVKELQTTPDPWLCPVGGVTDTEVAPSNKSYSKKRKDALKGNMRYVSLGKLMSVFVGKSFAATEKYQEVQLIFHAFNDSASHLHDFNIAQFPIEIARLLLILEDRFARLGSMTLGSFMSLISEFFIDSLLSKAYGLEGFYSPADGKKDGQTKGAAIQNATAKKKEKAGTLNTAKQEIFKEAYGYGGKDGGMGVSFRKPAVVARIQATPGRDDVSTKAGKDQGTILKIQFFDQQCRSTEALISVFREFGGSGIVSSLKRDYVGKPSPKRGAGHAKNMSSQFDIMEDKLSIIESFQVDKDVIAAQFGNEAPESSRPAATETAKKLLSQWANQKVYLLNTSANGKNIKDAITSLTPSITWGSVTNGLLTANLATQNDAALATINRLREPGKDNTEDKLVLPVSLMPVQFTAEILGCPNVAFGQQFFVDFGTNSSADNFYGVVGISHSLGPGEFKTSVTFVHLDGYGAFRAPYEGVAKIIIGFHEDAKRKEAAKKKATAEKKKT